MIPGKHITLRPARQDDRKQIYQWLAQSDVTAKMMGLPDYPDNPVPDQDEFLADYTDQYFNDNEPYSGRSYIILHDGVPAGHINYNEFPRGTTTVELDIWLAGSAFCNKGIGTDAINTLCSHLAPALGCRKFILAPSGRNKAAIRAYEKCGFRKTDAMPDGFVPDYEDTVVMIKMLQ
jgi:RimJ/RimL family protein N-acetyltransferase